MGRGRNLEHACVTAGGLTKWRSANMAHIVKLSQKQKDLSTYFFKGDEIFHSKLDSLKRTILC